MSVGNAIWLLLALPSWYFPSVLVPFEAGPLTGIPAIGVIFLVFGVVVGIIRPKRELLFFLIPAVLSEALVALAGAFRGRVANTASHAILLGFFVLQLLLISYLIYRTRNARVAAAALGVFSLSYAFFAMFIASMAFSDVWL
jgi:hypothetical protein